MTTDTNNFTGHTPGPWTSTPSGDGKCYIIGDGQSSWDTHVAEVYSDDTDRDEAAANNRLIQLATDLLRERNELREFIEDKLARSRLCIADCEPARELLARCGK